MTWLSKLVLNVRSRSVLRDLDNAYDMHRTLLKAFPDKTEGGAGRVRFRVEPASKEAGLPRPIVLVQSENRPDWLRVDPSYFVDDPTCKKMPAIAWQVGARLRFRLRANPTRRARSVSLAPDGGPLDARWVGKRIGLRREEDQIAWLHRKAGEGGFQVASVIVSPEANDRSRRAGATVTQTAVRFDGVLVITDPSRFQQSVDLGIGSSKGFGFGLLSVGNLTD